MDKIDKYKVVAALVRSFFEAFSSGIVDCHIKTEADRFRPLSVKKAMLNHYETPGYGYQIRKGATTLTEQWDPEQGSSLNHFMMGQIDEWLFKTLAGIQNQPGTHGLRHLLIAPTLVGDLQYVKASTASLYGKISVDCSRTRLTVEIPVGSDATIVLPDGQKKQVGSGRYTFDY